MFSEQSWVQIIVASIGSASAVAVAVLAALLPWLISTRRKATAAVAGSAKAVAAADQAREAITNGHPEHVRDSMDRQHEETLAAISGLRDELGGVKTDVRGIQSDIRGVRRDVGRVADRQDKTDERLATAIDRLRDVEDTQPHPHAGVPQPRRKR